MQFKNVLATSIIRPKGGLLTMYHINVSKDVKTCYANLVETLMKYMFCIICIIDSSLDFKKGMHQILYF